MVERAQLKPHALVTRDVHDQASRAECLQVLGPQIRQRIVRVLQRAVDHDVAFGQERRQRNPAPLGDDLAQEGGFVVVIKLDDVDGVDRGAHGRDSAVGQHLHVVNAMGVERGHGAAGGRAEADHHGTEASAVVTCGTGERECMKHRTVPGQLIVLVEDVQPETTVAGPVVHGFEGDECELLVDGQLGDGTVLDTVRPAPEDLAVAQFGEVFRLRLGQEHDVGLRQQRFLRGHFAHEG